MMKYDAILENEIEELLYSFLPKEKFSGDFESLKPLFTDFDEVFLSQNIKVIIIGGTNGKGETALHLRSLLEKSGHQVALFTSPHILSIRERFSFGKHLISYAQLKNSIEDCRELLQEKKLSFYEFLFYLFCYECSQMCDVLDYIILEVGLGGRKDAVNLLTPSLCALTSISRDHQEILGNTYRQILFEKLGIGRTGVALISNFHLAYLRSLSKSYCFEHKTPYLDLDEMGLCCGEKSFTKRNQIQAYCLDQFLKNGNFSFPRPKMKSFSFPPLKGRFELMTRGEIRFIFIGAHNIDGMRMLKDTLRQEMKQLNLQLPVDEIWLSFSQRKEEDIKTALKIFSELSPFYSKLWLTSFSHPKAWDLKVNLASIKGVQIPDQMEWKDRLQIMERDVKKTIAITGSYYFIGEVQKEILSMEN